MPSQPNPVTSIATRPQPAGLRVGDRERSDACDQLSAHFAAGRLSDDELEERLSAAVAGRTKSDLHRLLADLPPLTDSSRKTAAPATVPLPAGLASNVLDVFALIAVIGCVIMAGLGALLVLFSGDGAVIAVATPDHDGRRGRQRLRGPSRPPGAGPCPRAQASGRPILALTRLLR